MNVPNPHPGHVPTFPPMYGLNLDIVHLHHQIQRRELE